MTSTVASTKILNVDLTDLGFSENKEWFNQHSIDTLKESDPDIITIQSYMSANTTQDLIFLFGHEFDFIADRGGPGMVGILWKKNKFKAKEVDDKKAVTRLRETCSLSVAHLWATTPGRASSMTVASWVPHPKSGGKRDIGDKNRLKLLDKLMHFLGDLRETMDMKLRIVVCGHLGEVANEMSHDKHPYFKLFTLVPVNHVRHSVFQSPFIYTEDSLQACEMPTPNVFPEMSNKNLKMLCLAGVGSDDLYMAQFNKAHTSKGLAVQSPVMNSSAKTFVPPEKNDDIRESKISLMERVTEAFQFAALRKQVREDRAYQKAVERNKARQEGVKAKDNETDEIFPDLGGKKKKKKRRHKRKSGSQEGSSKEPRQETQRIYLSSTSTTSTLFSNHSNDGMTPVEQVDKQAKIARQKEEMMAYLTRNSASPLHSPSSVRQEVSTFSLSSATPSARSGMSSNNNVDFRKKATDLTPSPRHRPMEKHAPF